MVNPDTIEKYPMVPKHLEYPDKPLYANLDEAVDMIHSNPFGNAASIFTSSGKWAREFQYRVECGNIGVNIGIAAPMAFFPFSGMKDSFYGIVHGQGWEAVRFFTESKVVIQRWF